MTDITVERTNNSTNGYAFQMLEPDTLVQTLFDAIKYEWSNNAMEVIIKELARKGYDHRQLLDMVEEKFGKPAALKVIRIIFKQ
jgi:hypothetical protein